MAVIASGVLSSVVTAFVSYKKVNVDNTATMYRDFVESVHEEYDRLKNSLDAERALTSQAQEIARHEREDLIEKNRRLQRKIDGLEDEVFTLNKTIRRGEDVEDRATRVEENRVIDSDIRVEEARIRHIDLSDDAG